MTAEFVLFIAIIKLLSPRRLFIFLEEFVAERPFFGSGITV